MTSEPDDGVLRIADVAERTGLGVHTLRAWERRYGIPRPSRTEGRQRLYSLADVDRLNEVQALIRQGVAVHRAAALVSEGSPAVAAAPGHWEALLESLCEFDEALALRVWNGLLESFDIATVIREHLMPLLIELGDGWASGRRTIDQEHFASLFLRGRLLALHRQVNPPPHPVVLLACPAGEHHDLGILMCAVLVRYHGLRTVVLGADTPPDAIVSAARTLSPAVVVVSTNTPQTGPAALAAVTAMERDMPPVPVVVGGPGAAGVVAWPANARVAKSIDDAVAKIHRLVRGEEGEQS